MLARLLAIANLQQAAEPLSFCLPTQNIVTGNIKKKEVLR
jgi:hypothetical protein